MIFNSWLFEEGDLFGVVLQGFTFRSPTKSTKLGVGWGDVTFLDCLIEVRQRSSRRINLPTTQIKRGPDSCPLTW